LLLYFSFLWISHQQQFPTVHTLYPVTHSLCMCVFTVYSEIQNGRWARGVCYAKRRNNGMEISGRRRLHETGLGSMILKAKSPVQCACRYTWTCIFHPLLLLFVPAPFSCDRLKSLSLPPSLPFPSLTLDSRPVCQLFIRFRGGQSLNAHKVFHHCLIAETHSEGKSNMKWNDWTFWNGQSRHKSLTSAPPLQPQQQPPPKSYETANNERLRIERDNKKKRVDADTKL